jgi:hypothetical protein
MEIHTQLADMGLRAGCSPPLTRFLFHNQAGMVIFGLRRSLVWADRFRRASRAELALPLLRGTNHAKGMVP